MKVTVHVPDDQPLLAALSGGALSAFLELEDTGPAAWEYEFPAAWVTVERRSNGNLIVHVIPK